MNIPATWLRSHDGFYTDPGSGTGCAVVGAPAFLPDMESAALMTIGALRGLRTASLLNVVVATTVV